MKHAPSNWSGARWEPYHMDALIGVADDRLRAFRDTYQLASPDQKPDSINFPHMEGTAKAYTSRTRTLHRERSGNAGEPILFDSVPALIPFPDDTVLDLSGDDPSGRDSTAAPGRLHPEYAPVRPEARPLSGVRRLHRRCVPEHAEHAGDSRRARPGHREVALGPARPCPSPAAVEVLPVPVRRAQQRENDPVRRPPNALRRHEARSRRGMEAEGRPYFLEVPLDGMEAGKAGRLATCDEMPGDRLSDIALKTMTPGYPATTTARKMRGNDIEIPVTWTFIAAFNEAPSIKALAPVRDRIVSLRILHEVDRDGSRPDLPPADPHLVKKIEAEAPAVMAKLVDAARSSAALGAMPLTPRLRSDAGILWGEMDRLALFLGERLTVTKNPDDRIWLSDLREDYRQWVYEMEGVKAPFPDAERWTPKQKKVEDYLPAIQGFHKRVKGYDTSITTSTIRKGSQPRQILIFGVRMKDEFTQEPPPERPETKRPTAYRGDAPEPPKMPQGEDEEPSPEDVRRLARRIAEIPTEDGKNRWVLETGGEIRLWTPENQDGSGDYKVRRDALGEPDPEDPEDPDWKLCFYIRGPRLPAHWVETPEEAAERLLYAMDDPVDRLILANLPEDELPEKERPTADQVARLDPAPEPPKGRPKKAKKDAVAQV